LPEFSEPVIYPDKQGYVWIGGSEGLFRYDTHKKQRLNQPFYTLIRSVILGEDEIIFNGSFYTPQTDKLKNNVVSTTQTQQLQVVFPFNPQFLIQFQFATPYFDNEFANEYSHFLKGYDKTWSSWSKDNKTQYNSLFEGKYTFYVKARNIYGKESIVSTYSFSITPPWYRLLGVRFIFILLILLLIWWGIRLYTQNLVRQKTKLEQIVAARTQEISLKNVELEKQKEAISIQSHEIEKKNEDITASISYASRIQRAMLPRLEQIQEAFPDSFVWLQPKDIVSGDFYWFTETPLEPRFFKDPNIQNGKVSIFKGFGGGKKIIAAVDCTGHGIPGAFVSMMGDAYLNQIVNLENVSQAHLILKELHEYVRHALKQDDGENLDGMDMALCVIDPTNRDLEYAGAKNPLIYIQDNEIFIIKGDKYGIGGFQFEQGEKHFTRHTILLDKPTSFYLLSDGFEDQFGGEKGKKLSIKRIKELLLEHWQKPMSEQKEIYQQAFETWKADYPQVDDVLLLGVHINPSDFDI
jgi:serine phosphatase RsbU (regulator of sigma subunit)